MVLEVTRAGLRFHPPAEPADEMLAVNGACGSSPFTTGLCGELATGLAAWHADGKEP